MGMEDGLHGYYSLIREYLDLEVGPLKYGQLFFVRKGKLAHPTCRGNR